MLTFNIANACLNYFIIRQPDVAGDGEHFLGAVVLAQHLQDQGRVEPSEIASQPLATANSATLRAMSCRVIEVATG